MPTTIRMPQLGESVAEGTLVRWLKAAGDQVSRDEPIAEVMTDKVTAELPSPVAGVLSEILVQEGETVPVGAELARMTTADEPAAVSQTVAPPGPHAAGSGPKAGSAQSAAGTLEAETHAPSADGHANGGGRAGDGQPDGGQANAGGQANGERRFYTPVVLRMAAEHGIDLASVRGSGTGGRVTKKDIERMLEEGHAQAAAAATVPAEVHVPPPAAAPEAPPEAPRIEPGISQAAAAAPASAPSAEPTAQLGPDEEWIPLTPMRRAIAEHMVRSVSTAPHAWTMIDVDVTRLVGFRSQVLPDWQRREGFELTYLPFAIKAVVEALKEHPEVNSSWGGDKIILKRHINISIAVAVPDGLLVPVVHDADRKSIAGLAYAVRDLAQRARAGKLTLPDMQGGTFTVNNPGALGSIMSQPIINQPQAAILTTEAIQKRPVVRDDGIAIRDLMNVCLSFDHRVLDGAQVLEFLHSVKARLEAYGPHTPIY
jgi:2-oxoisovalerate dehydrogenase E2 component (dihydrolipoyl transacylase)